MRSIRSVTFWKWLEVETETIFFMLLSIGLIGCGTLPKVVVLNDPLSAKEHLQLGLSYEAKGEWNLAISEYQAALEKGESPSTIQGYLGNVYYGKKNYPKAEKSYRKALQLDPGNAPVLNNLAALYLNEGKELIEAERLVQRAIEVDPTRKSYYLDTLGEIYLARREYDFALTVFQEAKGLVPLDSPLFFQFEECRKRLLELLDGEGQPEEEAVGGSGCKGMKEG